MGDAGDQDRTERLLCKALSIRHERGAQRVGLWVPIVWHLAFRKNTDAMIELADWLTDDNSRAALGSPADSFSGAGLYRRAYRAGEARAAQHLAMGCFNRNDLMGYRFWLRRAAQAGDLDASAELRRFETRLPHHAARKIRRLRPERMWARDS